MTKPRFAACLFATLRTPGWALALAANALLQEGAAHGQVAVGGNFRVNAITTARQSEPNVAAWDGGFAVVWSGGSVQSGIVDVFVQRFGTSGQPIGENVRVNATTPGFHSSPAVASDDGGDLAIVWNAQDGAPQNSGIFGRRLTWSGTALGAEFRVNTHTSSLQYDPSVSARDLGTFVVVWSGDSTGDSGAVSGQRFGSGGAPFGGEFVAPTTTYSTQSEGDVAFDRTSLFNSTFVVVWTDSDEARDGSANSVWGQRFSTGGGKLGSEFRVNTTTTGYQRNPAVAVQPGGVFVVVWQSYGDSSDSIPDAINGQRFSGSGAPSGREFRVDLSDDSPREPDVAYLGDGDFAVTWIGPNVLLRVYNAAGSPGTPILRVNSYTSSIRSLPHIAHFGLERFVVVWESGAPDGDDIEVYGQLFNRNGDVNLDYNVNVSDILFLINHLFAGGPAPFGHADANGDLAINVSDVLYLINFLFAGGAPPV